MTKKTFFNAFLSLAIALGFLVPSLSFASTPTSSTNAMTPAATQQALITQLTQKIAELQAQLNALLGVSTVSPAVPIVPIALVSIPVSTHVDQVGGNLRITFVGFEKLNTPNSVAPTSPLAQTLGSFLLDYSACTSTFCQDPADPTVRTELWPGQSTIYMNEKIFLNGFATTSPAALLTVTPCVVT